MYVMLIMTSDASCVKANSFDDFAFSRQEVLNFYISGFIRRKKVLETGKCSVF